MTKPPKSSKLLATSKKYGADIGLSSTDVVSRRAPSAEFRKNLPPRNLWVLEALEMLISKYVIRAVEDGFIDLESLNIDISSKEVLELDLEWQIKLAWADYVPSVLAATIASIERRLQLQLAEIMNHDDLLDLEGKWRGLKFLVDRTDTAEDLKIKLLNISPGEVFESLVPHEDNLEHSPLYKLIAENEIGTMGGEPFGCVLWDQEICHYPDLLEPITLLSKIGKSAHCLIIAGVKPELFLMDDWDEISIPRNLTKIFQTPEYEDWRALREDESAKFLCLVMPRLIARPLGRVHRNTSVWMNEIAGGRKQCWMSGTFAVGAVLTRSFRSHGWFGDISGGSKNALLEGLPERKKLSEDIENHEHRSVEVLLTDRRAAELCKNGITTIIARKREDIANVHQIVSVFRSKKYDDQSLNEAERWVSSPAVTLSNARFIHIFLTMMRDRVGSEGGLTEMKERIANWISNYVDPDPLAHPVQRSRRPLRQAEVVLKTDLYGNEEMFINLTPHFQFENLPEELINALLSKVKESTIGKY